MFNRSDDIKGISFYFTIIGHIFQMSFSIVLLLVWRSFLCIHLCASIQVLSWRERERDRETKREREKIRRNGSARASESALEKKQNIPRYDKRKERYVRTYVKRSKRKDPSVKTVFYWIDSIRRVRLFRLLSPFFIHQWQQPQAIRIHPNVVRHSSVNFSHRKICQYFETKHQLALIH